MAQGITRIADMFGNSAPPSNPPHGVTPSDLQQMQQRRIEQHAARKTAASLNLLRAVKLGEALRELKE